MKQILSLSTFAVPLTIGALVFSHTTNAALAEYKPIADLSGTINSVGSDTLAGLLKDWSEEFKKLYPNVSFSIDEKGSGTAPPALIEGKANIGPMSREMNESELQAFQQKFGYGPAKIRVALDSIAVIVNKENPIKNITIPEIDAIYSSTGSCKDPKGIINTWGQLGVTGLLADQAIKLYGRPKVSGTYIYFKDKALCKGEYKASMSEMAHTQEIIDSVEKNIDGIGYVGLGYLTKNVRPQSIHGLKLAFAKGRPYIEPTLENAAKNKYPLSRALYIYFNKAKDKALSALELEFFKFILSVKGQEIVAKQGFIELPEQVAGFELQVVTANSLTLQ
jgi:phosphate transport system substrate-binding protein